MKDYTPLLDAMHSDIFYYYFSFLKAAEANTLGRQHGPLKAHAHSLKSTAVGPEFGTMESSTSQRKRGVTPGREAASPPFIPRNVAFHCGLNGTITAMSLVSVHHCQQFFWWFGPHVSHSRKLPGPGGFVLGPFGRDIRVTVGPFGNLKYDLYRG